MRVPAGASAADTPFADPGRHHEESTMNARTGSLLLLGAFAIGLSACDRRDPPIEPESTVPPNTAAPTAQSPARPPTDISDPSKESGVDEVEQKGTEAGSPDAAASSTEQTEKKE
jgi:hypothetical protein